MRELKSKNYITLVDKVQKTYKTKKTIGEISLNGFGRKCGGCHK